jgi:hypothetical protein
MRIDAMVQVTLNDGSTFVMATRAEATPDLNADMRENAVEAAARTFELMDEVKGDIERQVEQWIDPAVSWPSLEDPNAPIFRQPPNPPPGPNRRERRRGGR